MFKLELFDLLTQYKQATSEDQPSIQQKIISLLRKNKQDARSFIMNAQFDYSTQQWLLSMLDEIEQEKEDPAPITPSRNASGFNPEDMRYIKQTYERWRDLYLHHQRTIVEEHFTLVNNLVQHYLAQDFEVLQSILNIVDDRDYSDFKNMVNNIIRKEFARQIEEYYDGTYTTLSFFQKRKKKAELLKLTKDIGNYQFNFQKLQEVLQ